MPDVSPIAFTHREVVEAMVKARNIHEGVWGLYVEFGIAAANILDVNQAAFPAAIVPVVRLGLQKFEVPSSISIDAAVANPAPVPASRPVRRPRKAKKA